MLSCLCYITTLRFEFFTRMWSVRKSLLFRYMGRLVTYQQKCHFSLSPLHFCLLFGFVFIHNAQLRILKFPDSVYQKAEVCAQTINELRISRRSYVLLRRQILSFFMTCYFFFKQSSF